MSFHLLTEERLIPSAPPLVILTTSPGAQSLPHQVGYIKRAITLGDTVRSHYPVQYDSFDLKYTTVTLILHTGADLLHEAFLTTSFAERS